MHSRHSIAIALLVGLTRLGAQTDTVHHSPGAMRVSVHTTAGAVLTGAEIDLPMLDVKFAVPDGGVLLINHVPPGTYVLQVRRLGYTMQTRLVTVRRDTADVRFALEPAVAVLDTVNVNAKGGDGIRDFERRLRAANGRLFTSNDIARSHTALLKDFLATIPGVKLKPVSGLYDERAPLGAAGTCPSGVLVYLDGVPVNALEDSDPARALRAISPVVPAPPPVSTGGGSSGGRGGRGAAIAASQAGSTLNPIRESGALPPFDINQLELSRVAAMEVYPDGVPSQFPYGGGSKCGVVLLWSKPR